jgi:hypothetical protein
MIETFYKTSDGCMFNDKKKAEQHEQEWQNRTSDMKDYCVRGTVNAEVYVSACSEEEAIDLARTIWADDVPSPNFEFDGEFTPLEVREG